MDVISVSCLQSGLPQEGFKWNILIRDWRQPTQAWGWPGKDGNGDWGDLDTVEATQSGRGLGRGISPSIL